MPMDGSVQKPWPPIGIRSGCCSSSCKYSIGKEPSRLTLADMQAPSILQFLDSIEQKRGNCVRTRNVRLAAIRSFFRSVALRDPGSVDMATRVLAIPVKRWDHRLVGYRTRPEIDAILAAPYSGPRISDQAIS